MMIRVFFYWLLVAASVAVFSADSEPTIGLHEQGFELRQAGQPILSVCADRIQLVRQCRSEQTPVWQFEFIPLGGGESHYGIAFRNASQWYWEYGLMPPESEDDILSEYCTFTPNRPERCDCDFSALVQTSGIMAAWVALLDPIEEGLQVDMLRPESQQAKREPTVFPTAKLESLLSPSDLPEFEIANFGSEREWLLVVRNAEPHKGFAALFRQVNLGYELWYLARANAKSFHVPHDIAVQAQGSLAVTLCVEDCAWWGEEGQVILLPAKPAYQQMHHSE